MKQFKSWLLHYQFPAIVPRRQQIITQVLEFLTPMQETENFGFLSLACADPGSRGHLESKPVEIDISFSLSLFQINESFLMLFVFWTLLMTNSPVVSVSSVWLSQRASQSGPYTLSDVTNRSFENKIWLSDVFLWHALIFIFYWF